MSDNADRADARIAAAVQSALNKVRDTPSLCGDGHCHFCEEAVPDARVFCNADCRDDYQKHQAGRRRAGY
ncbi:DUF2116 family Zn-ribbon domain-containing protein [Glaciimonas immobilis]|uniref:DUF2116 family Zn-ribbon domain-containing protein n=1 Tax=Glaciimonas immobilis TaxID=728004 RepID=A0A840RP33_9BURK|nr:DUF2116 family Zn-ribbon domain-containing protein [Glaciimonas immobilis]KAF3999239.1 DUF2116 family Zn-ribbon domain-containing protein [Glaciimonas immobilis]MBB5198698.1 hypothetical protein [Glaciimonas immobilis]